MLIFHKFADRKNAEAFADAVAKEFPTRGVAIFDSQADSNRLDPFPFELVPPIVMVPRFEKPSCMATKGSDWGIDIKEEAKVEKMAKKFGGELAGT